MPAKVADASVIGALIFREPRADEAFSLIDGADLYEPPLLRYELISIARKKTLLYPDLEAIFHAALWSGLRMPMSFMEVNFINVLELSLQRNISTYDASYLYLSRTLDVPLVTFDRQLGRTI